MAELVGVVSPLLQWSRLLFGPIYRNTKSFFKLQSNLSSLQQKKTVLKEMEDGVKQELEAADKDGKLPTPRVKEWLRQVRGILVVADQMQPGGITDNRGLVSGCFLSCGVCRKVRKTLEEVQRLMDSCPPENERVVSANRPPPRVEHIPAPSIEDQTTAALNLNRVMDLLSQDEVQSVGIWGMGGVGKTTLVKNLNNKLGGDGSSGQHFGTVIWVIVSKDFNLKRVQAQIAGRLKMGLSDDEDSNAIKLHERLMKENNFLLILDDLWEAIDLDKLGIPNPQMHNGVKILITSRSKSVCENMRTDEQLQVSVLNNKEAWELFAITVGRVANLEGIKPIAQKVCQECCGLPLAIITVGAALRGKDLVPLWNDALSELQRSVPSVENIEKEVYRPLKWSYDRLQGNNVKSCFLYCCLYYEDCSILVSELVQCWMGEGLIDEELSYEESRNRGLALIQNLKEACLLEKGEPRYKEGDTVKMHDVVRDVAIWISSNHLEDGCTFLVRAGIRLSHISKVKFSSNMKRISFMHNDINRLPYGDECLTKYPRASTLFLQGNESLVKAPGKFLLQFPAMKVLNLGGTGIRLLPPSFMQLNNLRTLLLQRCSGLEILPVLGWEGLGRLQILDLSFTPISELPSEMARLIKLRELDLYGAQNLNHIPAGVFTMLSSLEILDMEGCGYTWGLKRAVEDGEAYLQELESLDTLRELFIQMKPETRLSWMINPTWVGELRKFALRIGVLPQYNRFLSDRDGRDKELIMYKCNHTKEVRTEYLLNSTKATSLRLYECGGMDKWVQNMGLNTRACFSVLKSLAIRGATISLGDSLGGAKYDLFPNLEYLSLHAVKGMRSISELAGHLGLTFSKLQHLTVEHCHEMKYLFSVGPHLILESFTEISIRWCRELEELFEYGHSVGIVPNLETIKVIGCEKVRKLPISGQNNNVKAIYGDESWWSSLEWDDPNTKTSLQPLFQYRGF